MYKRQVYAESGWKDQLTSYRGESITYDEIGNPISYRGSTLTWEGRRLTGLEKGEKSVSYEYDENGIRTKKSVNGEETEYYLSGGNVVAWKRGNQTYWSLFDGDGARVGLTVGGESYYYLSNAQGDVVGMVNSAGEVVARYEYDTWGKVERVTDGAGNEVTEGSHIGLVNPYRYRGYQYDEETGLYYLQSRYYDPEVGRFISADGYVSTGQGILGHNMYAYCNNNPVNHLDPAGEGIGTLILLLLGIGATVAGCSKAQPPSDYREVKSRRQNCYSYAFNLQKGVDPGDYSTGKNSSDYMYLTKDIYTVSEIKDYVMRDMEALNKPVRVVSSPEDCGPNEYIVALKTSDRPVKGRYQADYHFAVLLSDGTWADKPGKIF